MRASSPLASGNPPIGLVPNSARSARSSARSARSEISSSMRGRSAARVRRASSSLMSPASRVQLAGPQDRLDDAGAAPVEAELVDRLVDHLVLGAVLPVTLDPGHEPG